MWPWEHAAVGYLLYSFMLRARGHDPPAERETILLVLATQVPDLVDKPLSWGLGWFPSGYAIGHSVFVAMPIGLLVLVIGATRGYPRQGVAVVFGYWSHLIGDVLNPLRMGDVPMLDRVLWPIVEVTPYQTDYGIGRGFVYIVAFIESLASMNPVSFVLLYVLLPLVSGLVWLLDGAPGLGILRRRVVAVWHRGRSVVTTRNP